MQIFHIKNHCLIYNHKNVLPICPVRVEFEVTYCLHTNIVGGQVHEIEKNLSIDLEIMK